MAILQRAYYLIFCMTSISQVEAQTLAIYSMKPDGTDQRLILKDPELSFGSVNVSPDGKQLAFDSWPAKAFNPAKQMVHVCDADGKNLRTLLAGAMPKWSPNGNLLACQDYMHEKGVVVVGADGKGKELIAEKRGNPIWFDQGKGLAFLDWGRKNIQLQDLASGKRQMLRPQNFGNINHGFCISPDGETIAFIDGRAPNCALRTISLKNQARPRTVFRGQVCGPLSFHPDGKQMAFCQGSDSKHNEALSPAQIFILEVETMAVRKIENTQADELYQSPCFPPDGERLYFCSTAR